MIKEIQDCVDYFFLLPEHLFSVCICYQVLNIEKSDWKYAATNSSLKCSNGLSNADSRSVSHLERYKSTHVCSTFWPRNLRSTFTAQTFDSFYECWGCVLWLKAKFITGGNVDKKNVDMLSKWHFCIQILKGTADLLTPSPWFVLKWQNFPWKLTFMFATLWTCSTWIQLLVSILEAKSIFTVYICTLSWVLVSDV